MSYSGRFILLIFINIAHTPSCYFTSLFARRPFLPLPFLSFLPSLFLPFPASGVRLAGQHLSVWVAVGQMTFVCHCFAPHTSPREKGKELSDLHLPLLYCAGCWHGVCLILVQERH